MLVWYGIPIVRSLKKDPGSICITTVSYYNTYSPFLTFSHQPCLFLIGSSFWKSYLIKWKKKLKKEKKGNQFFIYTVTSGGSRYKQENFSSSQTENILSVNLHSFLEITSIRAFLWSCSFQNYLVKIQNCIVYFLTNELWDPHISSTVYMDQSSRSTYEIWPDILSWYKKASWGILVSKTTGNAHF